MINHSMPLRIDHPPRLHSGQNTRPVSDKWWVNLVPRFGHTYVNSGAQRGLRHKRIGQRQVGPVSK